MLHRQRQQIMVPLSLAMTVIAAFTASVFGIGVWCATISLRLDAVAAESAKVSNLENDMTRVKTILELQFPHAATKAMEKLAR